MRPRSGRNPIHDYDGAADYNAPSALGYTRRPIPGEWDTDESVAFVDDAWNPSRACRCRTCRPWLYRVHRRRIVVRDHRPRRYSW